MLTQILDRLLVSIRHYSLSLKLQMMWLLRDLPLMFTMNVDTFKSSPLTRYYAFILLIGMLGHLYSNRSCPEQRFLYTILHLYSFCSTLWRNLKMHNGQSPGTWRGISPIPSKSTKQPSNPELTRQFRGYANENALNKIWKKRGTSYKVPAGEPVFLAIMTGKIDLSLKSPL